MVTPDTPLSEVAHYLGAHTAALLVDLPVERATVILEAVKWTIIGFESQGILDPISLQEALHDFIVSTLKQG